MTDLHELRAELRADAAAVAEALLGPPSKGHIGRATARWGSRGSLALELRGPKAGLWHDHEAGTGGDLLALIQRETGCSFAAAVAWGRSWTGEGDQPRPMRTRPAPAQAPTQDDDTAAKQDAARRLWDAAVPMEGTPADIYLTRTRGIPRPPGGWPAEAMRWHSGVRAWLLAVRDTAGALVAIQRVILDADGRNLRDAAGHKVKRSLGPVADGVVRLPGRLPVLIAEGPETAAALWASTGHETWAALGSTARLTPPAFALLAADDDKRHSPADKARRKALARWRAAGLDVLPMHPWPVRRGDGSDFADLIAAEGPAAVKARISAALDPGAGTLPVRRVPLPIAGVRLDRVVRGFMEAAEAGGDAPPVQAIRVDLGVGKSHAVHREGAALVRRLRARGDIRAVALAVPTHELAGDAAARIAVEAPDLVARVWRGRGAPAPGREGTMCQEPDRVAEVRKLRLDVLEYACQGCPHFAGCDYLAQHKARADLWVVPAALLLQQPPKAMGDLAALVVDEPPQPTVESAALPVLDLARFDAIDGDRLAGQRLGSLRRLVLDATAELPDGPLPRAALADAGMTAEGAAELLALEWRTLLGPVLPPGASPVVRAAALRAAARNADLGRRTMLARAIAALLAPDGPALSGLVELRTPKTGPRELVVHMRRDVRDGWRVPTLILDGTLQLDLVRMVWPTAELAADVAVQAPHQRVRQVADGGFTLAALDADAPGLPDAERHRRERNLSRLRVRLHTEARRHTGRVLVACNKRVRLRLEALGMPGNVEMVHFNALRGLDRWRDAAAVIVVGWTLPPAGAVERQAGALTGAAVPATGYQRAEAQRELADGTWLLSEAWRHPDPLAEALRWAACEGELVQAVGRGRGVRRTAANPVDVLVLGEAVLPFAVELVPADNPGPDEAQLASAGIAYAEPAHASRAYPGLWRTPGAARMAAERYRTNPYGESSIGVCAAPPGTVGVRYQVAGPGNRPALAWVHMAAVPDPQAAIEAHLGALALFELVEPPQPPPAAAPSARAVRSWADPGPVWHPWTSDPSPMHGQTGPPDPGWAAS